MKAKFGTFLMVLGLLLVLASGALFVYNYREQSAAEQSVEVLMPQLVAAIQDRQTEPTDPAPTDPKPSEPELPEDPEDPEDPVDPLPTVPEQQIPVLPPEQEVKELPVVEIDGYDYIGFLTIPSLELELPVMADWSYPQLKKSPCRYVGSTYTDDLVIMAHNYNRHFGRIDELHPGDTVAFTDMDGNTTFYSVVALDVLQPTAVEEMQSGEYDLTLFTCTYGGRTRVTVRCDRIEEE